ncbi:MAG: leucyl aminopeptidase [Methylococcales bacterium]|nr:leucyl aminopeptidase [Methylococcales bacterium]
MDFRIDSTALEQLAADCVIVGVYEEQKMTSAALTLDAHFDQALSELMARGDITGKPGDSLPLNWLPGQQVRCLLLVGLGKAGAVRPKDFRKALAAAAQYVRAGRMKSLACAMLDVEINQRDVAWRARQIVQVFSDGLYQFNELKSKVEKPVTIERIMLPVAETDRAAAESGLQQGQAIAEAVDLAKRLADLPGNICTPAYLAETAKVQGQSIAGLEVNILEQADLERLNMGAFLAVSRGSRQPPKLIEMHYHGGQNTVKPIVLVGKGLTFDAGGISLKPGQGMDEMKYDMCGGAAVIATVAAAAKLKLPINLIGLVPASENLPDGDANKPGDILTSMSGKTIEVLNTDAEGRLILCDTLTYAERFDPDVVIDLATLTGACLVALGRVPSGLLGNDDVLCQDLLAAGEMASDSVWRLPLWEEYQELLKSNFADMANIGGRDAGTITAACFLARFAEPFRWAHLDIAGTAWRSGDNKGATGRPVPLLLQYLFNRANT